ncbi:hypothetical protein D2U88_07235 [Flagellimonas aequoris]|nr:hypothetical protein D2U88_07235 [Allomuricauda aequoris]
MVHGQEAQTTEFLEFNDRNNIVHGVYLGINGGFGKLNNENAYLGGLKLAYVANRKLEIGLGAIFLFSEQTLYATALSDNNDLIGVYGGLHVEPILFGGSNINVSFPILLGGGTFGFVDNFYTEQGTDRHRNQDDFDEVFLVEPGISLLFNISRYLQLETGVKYRFTSAIDLRNASLSNINGFSIGLGIKIGVFNLGSNRYKKSI